MTASVYIAGPMRGIKDFNFGAFYAAEVEVHNRFAQCGQTLARPDRSLSPASVEAFGGTPGAIGDGGEKCGVLIFNPARRDHETYGPDVNKSETGDLADLPDFDLREALGADLAWIAQHATHIYMLDGWENSKGAKAEKALAEALGVTVLYQRNDLPAYPEVDRSAMVSSFSAMPDPYAKAAERYAEVRITSETGGEKGQKLSQIGALDPLALKVVGEVAGFGARKYARYNYLKGYDWSLSYDAGQRHLMEFWGGTDLDPESGLPHVAHAAWQALALLSFYLRGVGTDDRPPKG